MRNEILLNSVDASTQQISGFVNFDKRAEWKLNVTSTGLDATPKIFIEESFTPGKSEPPTVWTVYQNPCSADGSFEIDSDSVPIEKKDFKLNWFRIRLEANGNTAGTLTASLHYKTFP